MAEGPRPPEGNRALESLEKRGGAVWAMKRGAGSLITLTYAGRRHGGVVVRGQISPDMHRGELVADFPDEELISLGWKDWKREWVLRTDMDRAGLLRMVEESIALLAPAWGNLASDYRLVNRPAGEEDAGYAQFGCLFATISAPVGAAVGAVVAIVGNSPLPVVEVGIFAASVGLVIGFFVLGSVLDRVLALVPPIRARAAELGMGLMLLVPGLVALLTWLIVAIVGPDDPTQLLWLSGGVIVAMFVASFVETGNVGTRKD